MDYMYQDKPYVFSAYNRPIKGDVFVNLSGNVVMRTSRGMSDNTRMILKPKEVFHTFGGVVFKETGEERYPKQDEWYLNKLGGISPYHLGEPCPCWLPHGGDKPKIVKPISLA